MTGKWEITLEDFGENKDAVRSLNKYLIKNPIVKVRGIHFHKRCVAI